MAAVISCRHVVVTGSRRPISSTGPCTRTGRFVSGGISTTYGESNPLSAS